MVLTDDGCILVDCGRCGGTGHDPVRIDHDPEYCLRCGGCGCDFWDAGILVWNLVIGAALCRAFQLGWSCGSDAALQDFRDTTVWHSGCQRNAP